MKVLNNDYSVYSIGLQFMPSFFFLKKLMKESFQLCQCTCHSLGPLGWWSSCPCPSVIGSAQGQSTPTAAANTCSQVLSVFFIPFTLLFSPLFAGREAGGEERKGNESALSWITSILPCSLNSASFSPGSFALGPCPGYLAWGSPVVHSPFCAGCDGACTVPEEGIDAPCMVGLS